MKYLKKYKLFEDSEFFYGRRTIFIPMSDDELNQLKDILLPLEDKGYYILADYYKGTYQSELVIQIRSGKFGQQNEINLSEIKDDIEFIQNYVSSKMDFSDIYIMGKYGKESILIKPNDIINLNIIEIHLIR